MDTSIIILEAIRFHMLYCSLYKFRYNNKLWSMTLCFVFPVFNLLFSMMDVESTMKLCMLMVINFITVMILYDISISAALLYDLLFFAILVGCEAMTMGIFMMINPHLDFGTFQTDPILFFEVGVLTQLFNYIMIIVIIKYHQKQFHQYTLSETMIFLLETLVTIVSLCIVVEFTYYQVVSYKIISFVLVLWTLGLLCVQIGFYFLFNQYIQGKRKEQELLKAQSYMEYQYNYYNLMKEQKEELHKIRHDIKNIMVSFQNISEEYKEEIQKYLTENSYSEDDIQINTGTPIVDAILYDKGKIAIQKDIDFQVGIEPEIFSLMENIDICILLCNLLDNAIEASEKCLQNRYIYVEARKVSGSILLKIRNSKSNEILLHEERFKTSKYHKDRHGYGMKNIQTIIDKYDGEKQVKYTEEEFQITILLSKY